MALKKCPECARDISDRAIVCPGCEFPLRPDELGLLTAAQRTTDSSGTIRCPECDRYVPNQALTCTRCGFPIRYWVQGQATQQQVADEQPREGVMFCTSCGTAHPDDANFCMKWGRPFHDAASPPPTPPRHPVVETRTFTIPFPEGSEPTKLMFNMDPEHGWVFKGELMHEYLLRLHGKGGSPGGLIYWEVGTSYIWNHWRSYFEERINELGAQGWQLQEPFEPPRIDHRRLANPSARFKTKEVETDGLFGKKKRHVFEGATFLMRRTTFQ